MKHASTQALFDYWNKRRGRRRAPTRSDINPADIRRVLGDIFTLTSDFADDIRFRLAGTRVCALFGREIKGETFGGLWNGTGRPQIDDLVTAVFNENIGTVVGAVGRTSEAAEVDLELLLLPLASDGRSRVRAIGALGAFAQPYWLGERPLVELDLRTFRHFGSGQYDTGVSRVGEAREAPLTRHGFLVYQGGRGPAGKPSG